MFSRSIGFARGIVIDSWMKGVLNKGESQAAVDKEGKGVNDNVEDDDDF